MSIKTQVKYQWTAALAVYLLLAAVSCALLWTYPAAAILLPMILMYGAASLLLRGSAQRKTDRNCTDDNDSDDGNDNGKKWFGFPAIRSILFIGVTDIYGLAAEGDSYFFFDVLCCADGIAMVSDLVALIKRIWKQRRLSTAAGNNSSEEQVLSEEKALSKVPKLFRSPALYITLYIVLGAILPFAVHPSVSESTQESVEATDFYSDEPSGERAEVISQNGEALEERIRLISQAQETIILSTFEIDADTSGKMVMAALMDAANRGVQVYMLVDGFSYLKAMWGNPYFLALAQTENVEIRIYNSIRIWKPWTFMGRLHDKYLIVDELAYILGGRNTYDYFLGDQEGKKNYDWDVLVYSADAKDGSSLETLQDYFVSVWNLSVCRTLADNHFWEKIPSVASAEEELRKLYSKMESDHADWMQPKDYEPETVEVNHIELVSNPTHIFSKEPVAFYTITELMLNAQEEVVFHTPYIICDDWMLSRLEGICENVDTVTLMTNSVANNGNPFGSSDYALHKEEILETGVQILEYDGGISYHGKCFVIDDRLSAIGSYNWDMRSTYIDTELMLVIDSEPFNQQLREEMQAYEKDALTVLDVDTSAAPAGKEAQEVSGAQDVMLRILRCLNWGRFLM